MILVNFVTTVFRKSSRSLGIALSIACLLVAVHAQPSGSQSKTNPEQEKAAVAQLEDQWLSALNSADVDMIAGILADDFVRPAPDSGRFITKADLLSYYRSHLKAIRPEERQIDDMTVSMYGTMAIARGLVIRSAADGHVTSRLLFTDVFAQRDGKWQAVSAQENPVTTPQSPTIKPVEGTH